MHQIITPFFRLDTQAREAADFYGHIFGATTVDANPMVTEIDIRWYCVCLMNWWKHFVPNPSISLSVRCADHDRTRSIRDQLIVWGSILMDFGVYPWSSAYGWCNDRFGISWQIMLTDRDIVIPSIWFTYDCESAIALYTSIFELSHIDIVHKETNNIVSHAEFTLHDQKFIAMDIWHEHKFSLNEWVSLLVRCDDQEQVDYYRDRLTSIESQCWRLKDKFGVSWQIIPKQLTQALFDPDQTKATYAMNAMMKMQKIIIKDLYM